MDKNNLQKQIVTSSKGGDDIDCFVLGIAPQFFEDVYSFLHKII